MTKEQEEAIEVLEKCWVMTINHALDDENTELKYAIKTVLSMLKEKDTEIKGLKIKNDEAWEEWNNLEQDAYEEEQRLKAKLDKKDKIIDKMAEYLTSIDFDEQCLEIPEICLSCPKEDDLDGYMHCIKQYFEKKVEEV